MTTISRGRYALTQDGAQAHLTLEPEDGPAQTHTIPAPIWRMLQGMAAGDGKSRLSPAALMRALRAGGGS